MTEKLSDSRDKLESSEARLRVIHRIDRIFLLSTEDAMYQEILEVVLEATGSAIGIFGYLDDDRNWVCRGISSEAWKKCGMSDKSCVFPEENWGGLWGKALAEKTSLWSTQATAPTRWTPAC